MQENTCISRIYELNLQNIGNLDKFSLLYLLSPGILTTNKPEGEILA